VQTRKIGIGAIAETSITEKQSISLIYTYIEEQQWQAALGLAEDVLFNNPTCAEAIWCNLLATHKAINDDDISTKINNFTVNDYGTIEKILNCASKDFAESILEILYNSEKDVLAASYKQLLVTILPYSFSKRQSRINRAFDGVIKRSKYEPFKLLLTTLKSTDVDKYISYNYEYANKSSDVNDKIECLSNILNVDAGNVDALRLLVKLDLINSNQSSKTVADFENLLKYSPDPQEEVVECIKWLGFHLETQEHCVLAKQILRYYSGDISMLTDQLIDMSYRMIWKGYSDEAEYFLNLILSFDQNNPDVYWGICLMKIHAKDEDDVVNSDIPIKSIPEFNKFLTLIPEEDRRKYINISKEQEQQFLLKEEKLAQKKAKLEQQRSDLLRQKKEEKRNKIYIYSWLIMIGGFLVAGLIALSEEVNVLGIIVLVLFGIFATKLIARLCACSKNIVSLNQQIEQIDQKLRELSSLEIE